MNGWVAALYERLEEKWNGGSQLYTENEMEGAWDAGYDAGYEEARDAVQNMTRTEIKEWLSA